MKKRPELQGLITEWMPANQLAKQVKPGDLLEFRGTKNTLSFHHWSICVKVNNETKLEKRTPTNVKMLQLTRVGKQSLSGSELFNFGLVFVSAKVGNFLI